MRLSILPEVLFDEFPTDDTVKYCIFTQPKYPQDDYSRFKDRVMFCGTESTLTMMAIFKKLSWGRFIVLSDRRVRFVGQTSFGIRAIPTGNVSGSVMLLIEIGADGKGDIHLYTGQFTQCREVLLNSLVLHYRNRITDIHVDNTLAAIQQHGILNQACDEIIEIVRKHPGYRIFLHMGLFGYEELLYELARNKIKIQLNTLQTILFKQFSHIGDLFEYDGEPDLKVYAEFQAEKPFQFHQYKSSFEKHKDIHIKLVMSRNEIPANKRKIDGLFTIPYSPHPTAFQLLNLLKVIQPRRIHPLIKQCYADEKVSVIPPELLMDGCEIVGYNLDDNHETNETETNPPSNGEDKADRSLGESSDFLEESPLISGEIPDDFVDIVFDDFSLPPNRESPSKKSTPNKSPVRKLTPNRTRNLLSNEIISLDDEDEANDDNENLFSLAIITHSDSTKDTDAQAKEPPQANPAPNSPETRPQAENSSSVLMVIQVQQTQPHSANAQAPIENDARKSSDANNNEPTQQQKPTEPQISVQNKATRATLSSALTKKPNGTFARRVLSGPKRKASITPQRIRSVEYLSNSDEEADENVNLVQNKKQTPVPKKSRLSNSIKDRPICNNNNKSPEKVNASPNPIRTASKRNNTTVSSDESEENDESISNPQRVHIQFPDDF